MFFMLPNRVLIALLNHLLAGAPWARLKMMQHAHKRITLSSFPLHVTFEFDADGWLRLTRALPVDASLHISPLLGLRLVTGDASARHEIEISGDAQLAASFGNMLLNLDWDAEADLSRIVGDSAAHYLLQAIQKQVRWERNRHYDNLTTMVEYASEETTLLAKRRHINEFIVAIDTLRDQQARLDKRIDRLMQQLPADRIR